MSEASSPLPVCIVGAGLAGLAAAHALTQAGVACVLLDKSRGVSGRAATRWRDVDGPAGPVRWRVDHGAQVFNPDPGSPADRLARRVVGPDGVVEIGPPTIPFDDDGTVRPERVRPGAPRLAFTGGYAALGRALADSAPGLDLRLDTSATRLAFADGEWSVDASTPTGDARLGPFRAVVMTPPGPQAADLVRASAFDPAVRDRLAQALAAATYRSQWTVVLAFDEAVALPHGAYALVNAPADAPADAVDGVPARTPHGVAWLALESAKPGRAPRGASILVAQMGAGWTQAHYDDARETIARQGRVVIETLAGPLPEPIWTDTQRWRYSLPDAAADAGALAAAEALGLIVAGDAVAGKGRAHLALESGLDAAARIVARLG